ncbi:hypothetical protein BDZ91DRAFT_799258 [Kalaharituber pfeilii]|nr:hypothetical protein BDZ91DRAFT_799258 [Kalaharituber pfeilii]
MAEPLKCGSTLAIPDDLGLRHPFPIQIALATPDTLTIPDRTETSRQVPPVSKQTIYLTSHLAAITAATTAATAAATAAATVLPSLAMVGDMCTRIKFHINFNTQITTKINR